MRKLFAGAVLALSLLSMGTGCSTDPQRAVKQLVIQWDNVRLLEDDWERFWLVDRPSQLRKYFDN